MSGYAQQDGIIYTSKRPIGPMFEGEVGTGPETVVVLTMIVGTHLVSVRAIPFAPSLKQFHTHLEGRKNWSRILEGKQRSLFRS